MNKSIVILFFIAVLALSQSGCSPKQEREVKVPTVVVTDVVQQDVREQWPFVGETKADPRVDIVARVRGFLEKRNFEQGTFVKKGDLLLQIQQGEYQAKVLEAKGEVVVKRAVLKNAKIEYERKKGLLVKNTISKSEFEKATADMGSAEGYLKTAEAKQQQAELDLSYTNIKSPIDGRIGLSKYNVGNMVGPDSGVLATVVALNPIFVDFNITEAAYLRCQEAASREKAPLEKLFKELTVSLLLADDTKYPHPGKITLWNNVVDSATGTMLMRARFENPNHVLLPGQYVKVVVENSVAEKALLIPEVCIQTALGGRFVMLVNKENKVETRNVKTGFRYGSMIVIKEGLSLGEKVISQGIQKVRQGMTVETKVDETPYSMSNDDQQASEKTESKSKEPEAEKQSPSAKPKPDTEKASQPKPEKQNAPAKPAADAKAN